MGKQKPGSMENLSVHFTPEEQVLDGCPAEEVFILQVLGNSMEPTFPHRSMLIIEPTKSCQNGDFVIALQDEEYIFRKLVVGKDGNAYLVALNRQFTTHRIQHMGCIVGRVLKCVGTRRRDVYFDDEA